MSLQFIRGDSVAPVGHALIYFHADDVVLATYVSVPPIKFDLSAYMPGFLATAMQGMDLGESMVATPIPPIPEEVAGEDYLKSLAERRQDDLIYAGVTMRSDPMRLAAETAELARSYGELYETAYKATADDVASESRAAPRPSEIVRFEGMTQLEQLNELSALTGRMLDSVGAGTPDLDVERQMRALSDVLPAKYRISDLLEDVHQAQPDGQRLAKLYIERAYKLYNEDYLDLERIDKEIEAIHG
ncbi:MAG: hypothetical protein ACRDFX_04475 [Chloroflexota bacterium]